MKRYRSALLLITTVFAIVSCGGGGEGGDNMNDYWVSAARFANGSKKIKLVNGPGFIIVTPQENINIGPDADDPADETKEEATSMTATTAEIEIHGANGLTGSLEASNVRYETNKETKTATLTIRTITQPTSSTTTLLMLRVNLIDILGGNGRTPLPNGGFTYWRISDNQPVVIRMSFDTGTWEVTGLSNNPDRPALEVQNAVLVVVPAY